MKNYAMKGEAAILLRQDMAEERRRDEEYLKAHGGRTPAEDGERAARRELSANADSFAKASGSYRIVKAALALIKAQAALEVENFELVDWEGDGRKVTRIEVKDLVDGNKFWVTL